MHRFALPLALTFLLLAAAPSALAQTPLPAPADAKSLFKDRPFGPLPPPTPTPSPRRIVVEEEKPIPTSWKIGGIVTAVLALLALLYAAARAWRSSNLFDRQYRFPEGGEAALRFGAVRCGGHMATIQFGPVSGPRSSKTKDA